MDIVHSFGMRGKTIVPVDALPNSLGKAIRQRRKQLDLTQEELAGRISDGMMQGDVSALELGRVQLPRRPRLERIASALELPLGELLARSGWTDAEAYFRVVEQPGRDGTDFDPAEARERLRKLVEKLPADRRLVYAERMLRSALSDPGPW